jgi:hypothetical protein
LLGINSGSALPGCRLPLTGDKEVCGGFKYKVSVIRRLIEGSSASSLDTHFSIYNHVPTGVVFFALITERLSGLSNPSCEADLAQEIKFGNLGVVRKKRTSSTGVHRMGSCALETGGLKPINHHIIMMTPVQGLPGLGEFMISAAVWCLPF